MMLSMARRSRPGHQLARTNRFHHDCLFLPTFSCSCSSGSTSNRSSQNYQSRQIQTPTHKRGRGRRRTSSKNSRPWMKRHVEDPYVQKAQKEGIVSRSYYKLEQMDRKLNLFAPRHKNNNNHNNDPNMMVVDLGASPGGWSVYASRQMGSRPGGALITIDLLPLDPTSRREIEQNFSNPNNNNNNTNNLIILQGDFIQEKHNIQQFIRHTTTTQTDDDDNNQGGGGGGAQVVLSDMASNFTGDSSTDALRTMNLIEEALDFAIGGGLAKGGIFVGKYFSCGSEEQELRSTAKRHFRQVKTMKPPASRKESAERYLVAINFVSSPGRSLPP